VGFISVLSFAHQLVGQRVRPGETVADATAGNGNDTLFLAKQVGAGGRVYGFDIQREAIEATRRKLEEAGIAVANGEREGVVRLVLDSHTEMARHIDPDDAGRVAAVMFNLGYLPGSDRQVITLPDSTLSALNSALSLLRPGGILTAVVYPGHPGGQEEAEAVEAWASALPQREAQALVYRFANRRPSPPYLIAVEKIAPFAIIDKRKRY
jgi:SAM-dependent methyltransferase